MSQEELNITLSPKKLSPGGVFFALPETITVKIVHTKDEHYCTDEWWIYRLEHHQCKDGTVINMWVSLWPAWKTKETAIKRAKEFFESNESNSTLPSLQ